VTVYNESSTGDLSNNRAAPTLLSFTAGQNYVFAQTGAVAGVTDRDYFTFVVPANFQLSSLTVVYSSLTAGNATFLGLQAGSQVTVDPAAPSAAPLLGYELVSPADIGVNILPAIATAPDAAGFVPPLSAGQYSVWVQDSNVAPSLYDLRFEVSAIPEPSAALLSLVGLTFVGGAWWRKRSQSAQ